MPGPNSGRNGETIRGEGSGCATGEAETGRIMNIYRATVSLPYGGNVILDGIDAERLMAEAAKLAAHVRTDGPAAQIVRIELMRLNEL